METALRKEENQDLQDVDEILLNQKRKNENEERIDDASSVSKKLKAPEPRPEEEDQLCVTNTKHVEDDKKCPAKSVLDDAALDPTKSQRTSEDKRKQCKKMKPKLDDHFSGLRNNTLETFCQNIRKSIFQTIQALPSLTTLSIQARKGIDVSNGLGEALMNNKSIRDFSFEVSKFRDEVKANKLASALMQSQIQKLRVNCRGFYCPTRENDGDVAILTILEAIQQLMMQSLVSLTIALDSGRPLMGVFTCLGNGLQHTTTLKELVVVYNGYFDEDSMRVFSQGLRQNSSLTTLRLPAERIDDDNVVVLAEHLHQDLPLETLEFRLPTIMHTRDGIGGRGALALVRAVAHIPTMQTLIIKSLAHIDHKDMRLIGAELSHLCLRELHLFFSSYVARKTVSQYILKDEQKASRQALLQGMKENKYIQKLAVYMGYDSDFKDELEYYLNFNRWGRRLLTMDHGLPSTIWCYVLGRAGAKRFSKHVHSFVYYILCEQPNLIQASW